MPDRTLMKVLCLTLVRNYFQDQADESWKPPTSIFCLEFNSIAAWPNLTGWILPWWVPKEALFLLGLACVFTHGRSQSGFVCCCIVCQGWEGNLGRRNTRSSCTEMTRNHQVKSCSAVIEVQWNVTPKLTLCSQKAMANCDWPLPLERKGISVFLH